MKVVDFHTHVLPGADHGSDSLETSLKQLSLALATGVDAIFATSHFYPHRHSVEDYISLRNKAYENLISSEKYKGPEIKLGAEVLLCAGIERLPILDELCFFGTKIILIELPFSDLGEEHSDSVKALIDDGYTVVLAHADRYLPEFIDELISFGALIQLNTDSLDTLFKRKQLYSWIDSGVVVGIGSDLHKVDKGAYRSFSRAVGKLGKQRASAIMHKSSEIWDKVKSYKKASD